MATGSGSGGPGFGFPGEPGGALWNGQATRSGIIAVWGGEERSSSGGPTQVPIVQSVSFGYGDVDDWLKVGKGLRKRHIYGRDTNPTVEAFEHKVRMLDRQNERECR
jgi:O-acetylhomoserine/O-acetylserine sulfhydrylase-like pyridoxal-dependent enzyme